MQVACHISLESSRWGLKLCFRTHFNQRFTKKSYGFPKSWESRFWDFGIPNLGVPGQNDIWMQALWLGIDNTIRGRWWLPLSSSGGKSCESMFVHGLSMHQKCSNHALTNLLFGLCRSVWIIDLLVIHLNPHLGVQHAPLPQSTTSWESYPNSLSFRCFHIGFAFESIKELGSVLISTYLLTFNYDLPRPIYYYLPTNFYFKNPKSDFELK